MTATVTTQKVRAKIEIGNADNSDSPIMEIFTPDVVSFNVSRKRGQKSATFSASVKVPYNTFLIGSPVSANTIRIYAGVKSANYDQEDPSYAEWNLKRIFTGYIYQMVVNPIRTDASKIMLNLSGSDTFSIMDGQNITRRIAAKKMSGRFGVVTGIISSNSSKPMRFLNKPTDTANLTPNLISKDPSDYIKTPGAFDTSVDRSGGLGVMSGLTAEIVEENQGTESTT